MSLVCFCGQNLVSDGNVWMCPMRGIVTAFDKEKERHRGVVIVDKRVTTQEAILRRKG